MYNFYFFFFLTAVTRLSILINRRDESKHPCLTSDFSRNTFSFSLLHIIFNEFFISGFIMSRYIPSISISNSLVRVLMMNDIEFYQMIFLHLLRWSCGFDFCICGLFIDWFAYKIFFSLWMFKLYPELWMILSTN